MTVFTQAGKGIAVVTIDGGATMSPQTRDKVVRFLRRQANFLKTHGDRFSKRYRARYMEKLK
jgi:hypothetical protein